MNNNIWKKRGGQPSDDEIERDVAELRRLLANVEGPKEPHPAYHQNFLVRVRERIDEDRFRRRRIAPSTVWASVSAAALVVVLVVGGVFSPGNLSNGPGPTIVETPRAGASAADPLFSGNESASDAAGDLLAVAGSVGEESLILSSEDVKMLNAIVGDDDPDAIFEAIVDAQ